MGGGGSHGTRCILSLQVSFLSPSKYIATKATGAAISTRVNEMEEIGLSV